MSAIAVEIERGTIKDMVMADFQVPKKVSFY
jgi:hypothetical protein